MHFLYALYYCTSIFEDVTTDFFLFFPDIVRFCQMPTFVLAVRREGLKRKKDLNIFYIFSEEDVLLGVGKMSERQVGRSLQLFSLSFNPIAYSTGYRGQQQLRTSITISM